MTPKKPFNQPREQPKSARRPPGNRADVADSIQSKGSKTSDASRESPPMKTGIRPQSR